MLFIVEFMCLKNVFTRSVYKSSYWSSLVCCHLQQYFNYIVAVSFFGGGKEDPEKTTNLSQVTDKFDLWSKQAIKWICNGHI
jgi:hypothetical protein